MIAEARGISEVRATACSQLVEEATLGNPQSCLRNYLKNRLSALTVSFVCCVYEIIATQLVIRREVELLPTWC